ncbi:MAG: metal-sensitive transcriptional regulator [Bdellovibrionota bacterium]
MRAIKTKKSIKSSTESCCETYSKHRHPDHSEFLPRLNRIEGQLSGVQKMIQEGRYCVDILVQFRAVMAALRSVEVSIFERHLEHCIRSALLSKDKPQIDEKIRELTDLLTRRTSL